EQVGPGAVQRVQHPLGVGGDLGGRVGAVPVRPPAAAVPAQVEPDQGAPLECGGPSGAHPVQFVAGPEAVQEEDGRKAVLRVAVFHRAAQGGLPRNEPLHFPPFHASTDADRPSSPKGRPSASHISIMPVRPFFRAFFLGGPGARSRSATGSGGAPGPRRPEAPSGRRTPRRGLRGQSSGGRSRTRRRAAFSSLGTVPTIPASCTTSKVTSAAPLSSTSSPSVCSCIHV